MRQFSSILSLPVPTVLATLALAGCASVGSSPKHALTPGELVARGRYAEALKAAKQELEEHPDDPTVQQREALVEAAWNLDLGRRAFEEDDDRLALRHFEAARGLAPHATQPAAWIHKLRTKIADRALGVGLQALRDDELERAAQAFEEVLEMRPDDLRATESLAQVLLSINYRSGLGEDYYNKGVRSLAELELFEAKSKIEAAGKYLGEAERVERRSDQVNVLLAGERVALAEGFAAEDRWGAAKNEYRLALLLAPDHEEAQQGYDLCKVEARAEVLYKEAELMILKRRYDKALEMIEEGLSLTEYQAGRLEGLRDSVTDARLHDRYQDASDLESDFRYAEALAAFQALIDEVGFYDDAIARRDTLQAYITKAEALYAQAEAESDSREELLTLREIAVFWPEYRDIQERMLDLDDALDAAASPQN